MSRQQSSFFFFTAVVALCISQFVFCEESHGLGPRGLDLSSGLGVPDHGGSEDLSRYARASPLRWGKRTTGQNNILRWGKRGEDDDEVESAGLYREEVLQSRPVREAPLRWGKRFSGGFSIAEGGLQLRHLRASPLRWGKRSFGDDKRAPLRWGKRTPSRFGKREMQQEEDSEPRYDIGPFY